MRIVIGALPRAAALLIVGALALPTLAYAVEAPLTLSEAQRRAVEREALPQANRLCIEKGSSCMMACLGEV
jgi:hypothetical protein